jgi:hypothetical protein
MFKESAQFIFGALILLGMAATTTHVESKVQIAVAGLYEYQWQIKPGGDWWGIFPDGKVGYTLQPTRVGAVPDPDMVGAQEKAPRQIRVPGKSGGIVVFRGLMAAAAGPLKSVKLEEYQAPLKAGTTFDLRWDSDTPDTRLSLVAMELREVNQSKEDPAMRLADYSLWLQRGSGAGATRQLLFKESEDFGDRNCNLRWAGDLDRDGQLDLIYNLGGHYTETRLALYLSSAAKPGELVGLVARWDGSCGC